MIPSGLSTIALENRIAAELAAVRVELPDSEHVVALEELIEDYVRQVQNVFRGRATA